MSDNTNELKGCLLGIGFVTFCIVIAAVLDDSPETVIGLFVLFIVLFVIFSIICK